MKLVFSPILVENQFHPQFDNFILHVKVQHLFQTLVLFKKILLVLGEETCAKNYGSERKKSFVFLQKHKNKMLSNEWQ
jgi:hypothetical protein